MPWWTPKGMEYDSVWVPAAMGKLAANPGLCRIRNGSAGPSNTWNVVYTCIISGISLLKGISVFFPCTLVTSLPTQEINWWREFRPIQLEIPIRELIMTGDIDLLIIGSPETSNGGRNRQKIRKSMGFSPQKSYGLWGNIELWGFGSFLAPTELVDTKLYGVLQIMGYAYHGLWQLRL